MGPGLTVWDPDVGQGPGRAIRAPEVSLVSGASSGSRVGPQVMD